MLLQWIARHTDQAASAAILLPPFERPETWLADIRVKSETYHTPLGRVLEVQKSAGYRLERAALPRGLPIRFVHGTRATGGLTRWMAFYGSAELRKSKVN